MTDLYEAIIVGAVCMMALAVGAVAVVIARRVRRLAARLLRAGARELQRAVPLFRAGVVLSAWVMGLGLLLFLVESAARFWRNLL